MMFFKYAFVKSIFLIVFNTLFFVLKGTENTDGVWIAYSLINIAYVILLLSTWKIKKDHSVLTYNSFQISFSYFLLQFVIGLIVIFIDVQDHTFISCTQFVLLAIALLILTINSIANSHTEKGVSKQKQDGIFIDKVLLNIRFCKSISQDKYKTIFSSLENEVSSLPRKCSDKTTSIEEEILNDCSLLSELIKQGGDDEDRSNSLVNGIKQKLETRNILF